MRFDPTRERRREHRLDLAATAVVFLEGVELGEFAVDNLSLAGALLTGDIGAAPDDPLTVMLTVDGQETIEIDARVVRVARSGGCTQLGVGFEHASWVSEDALRAVLLGGHDRAEPWSGPELEIPSSWELDDTDLDDILPALG